MNADDSRSLHLGDAKAFGVGDLFEKDVRSGRLAAEPVGGFADAFFNDVVAQNDADFVPVGEVLRKGERVGDAAFAFLVGIVDVLEAKLLAVREQAQEVAEFRPPVTSNISVTPASTSVRIG